MADLSVEIRRVNSKLQFEAVSDSNPNRKLSFDFAPPLGDGQGFTGLELLLVSLGGCISTTVVFLLQRLEKHIESYTATISGTRSERPMALQEAHMMIRIKAEDISTGDMEATIQQAQAIAPVWQAVKNNVAVHVAFEIT